MQTTNFVLFLLFVTDDLQGLVHYCTKESSCHKGYERCCTAIAPNCLPNCRMIPIGERCRCVKNKHSHEEKPITILANHHCRYDKSCPDSHKKCCSVKPPHCYPRCRMAPRIICHCT
ncbi:hypothetical protein ILUMI_13592 [Ignelater luminosus]|uniref:Uncharacterized protein n=1 Tax=Ignelater luminosus TaxID=2038154 RepID=A0A8K0CU58_IGNLU|nr:hypothetical protein ILUMI_13592 [Ignelater luminosus]